MDSRGGKETKGGRMWNGRMREGGRAARRSRDVPDPGHRM